MLTWSADQQIKLFHWQARSPNESGEASQAFWKPVAEIIGVQKEEGLQTL